MSPQCNDKGKKNYLIEKIHSQRFDTNPRNLTNFNKIHNKYF